ncbi:MAG: helix-turn-helix domain-containing protein [Ruminococcus sp.]|nr:helix-turn-helix domain-containing protein [Ruminococcus sp.]
MAKKNKIPNNLKYMREVYGCTQEEVAARLGVSRVSISNWENGTGGRMSRANQEKLARLYGLGPEYFYDLDIDKEAKRLITAARKSLEDSERISNEKREIELKKEQQAEGYNFKDAVENYMNAMKTVIGLAENCSMEELELAVKINEQLNKRFQSAFDKRKNNIKQGDEVETLFKKFLNTESGIKRN